ncbi:MAG: endolytic transglycosylase MltG [Acutalibacteraceae bacterium]
MDGNSFNEKPQDGGFSVESNSPEDDFIIGKGFEIDEAPVQANAKRGKSRHLGGHSLLKTLIWVLCIIIVSVAIAFGAIYAGADYMGIGFGRGTECTIEIEQGMGTAQIAEELKDCGAVKIPFLFRMYAKLKHYDSQFKYGVYTFNNEAGYEALSVMLIEEGAKAESVHVTIPEMSSVDDIAKILEENGVCTKSDFLSEVQNGEFDYDFVKDIPEEKVYYRLEGYLFPDSYDFYNFDSKECAHLAVEKMLKTLDQKLTADIRQKISDSGYTLHEIMTMASIVELEAGGSPDEMANVAAVFFNRLKSDEFSTLGSSPTRKYPYGSGRYNTYEAAGLPPGPLCSPSLNSIKASAEPTENFDYYYFVTDASMKFYYNKILAEHNSTIARLKAANNWIYED